MLRPNRLSWLVPPRGDDEARRDTLDGGHASAGTTCARMLLVRGDRADYCCLILRPVTTIVVAGVTRRADRSAAVACSRTRLRRGSRPPSVGPGGIASGTARGTCSTAGRLSSRRRDVHARTDAAADAAAASAAAAATISTCPCRGATTMMTAHDVTRTEKCPTAVKTDETNKTRKKKKTKKHKIIL